MSFCSRQTSGGVSGVSSGVFGMRLISVFSCGESGLTRFIPGGKKVCLKCKELSTDVLVKKKMQESQLAS